MKTLPLQFKSGEGGYSASPLTYNQIIRNEDYAIYQRLDENGKTKDFEVIAIRIIPAGTAIFGQPPTIEDEEKYAVTSSWGRCGWTFKNLGSAQNKYNELISQSVKEDVTETNVDVDGVKYFTVGQYATNNNIPYVNANIIVKELLAKGTIKFIGEKRLNAKGKASKIFAAA